MLSTELVPLDPKKIVEISSDSDSQHSQKEAEKDQIQTEKKSPLKNSHYRVKSLQSFDTLKIEIENSDDKMENPENLYAR